MSTSDMIAAMVIVVIFFVAVTVTLGIIRRRARRLRATQSVFLGFRAVLVIWALNVAAFGLVVVFSEPGHRIWARCTRT